MWAARERGKVCVPSAQEGDPQLGPRGRENREGKRKVLCNPPDWWDVSGTRGRGEGLALASGTRLRVCGQGVTILAMAGCPACPKGGVTEEAGGPRVGCLGPACRELWRAVGEGGRREGSPSAQPRSGPCPLAGEAPRAQVEGRKEGEGGPGLLLCSRLLVWL